MVIRATLKWRCDDKRLFLATKVVVQPTNWWSSPATADPLSAKKGGLSQQNTMLVGGIPTPLKNMISSVGMMKFPIYGNKKNVPNLQPAMI